MATPHIGTVGYFHLPQRCMLFWKEEMTSEQAVVIARVVVNALYAESRFYYDSTGAEGNRYRDLCRTLAMAKCDQIDDQEFKRFLVSVQPIFRDAEQYRRDFVANYYSDPETIKAMAEATKKMGRLLEDE